MHLPCVASLVIDCKVSNALLHCLIMFFRAQISLLIEHSALLQSSSSASSQHHESIRKLSKLLQENIHQNKTIHNDQVVKQDFHSLESPVRLMPTGAEVDASYNGSGHDFDLEVFSNPEGFLKKINQ